jgi:WD40 repeat protein
MSSKRGFVLWSGLILSLAITLLEATAQDITPTHAPDTKSETVTALAWSPDGEILAMGGSHGVRLITSDTFVEIAHFDGHIDSVTSIAWNPAGDKLASASWDRTVIIWDVNTQETLTVFRGHEFAVSSVAWHPDGSMVASGDLNGAVQIWDPLRGQSLYVSGDPAAGSSYSVGWSVDGRFASSDVLHGVCIRNVETNRCTLQIRGHIYPMIWSPNGAMIATASEAEVQIWDTTTGEHLRTFEGHWHNEYAFRTLALAWSPDDNSLASNSVDKTVRIWDATTGDTLAVLEEGLYIEPARVLGYVNSLAWSPDGTRLAAAGDDGFVRIWDTTTYRLAVLYDIRYQFALTYIP